MSLLSILGIAVALAIDAFSVALATGIVLPKVTWRHCFRLSFHFGLFQFLMPIIGWLLGSAFESYVHAYAPWIAFGLLALVGGKMIVEALGPPRPPEELHDPTRKGSLVMLSVATSIDALAVGISLSLLGAGIWAAAVVIGIVAAGLTLVGLFCGERLGVRFGHRMGLLGGIVLFAIGIRIIAPYLLS
ncbi:MAG: manganese efflux pump MntP family protein [bacterium]